jgi:LPS sulfotransferase NodH
MDERRYVDRGYMVCATPRSGSGLLCRGLEATGVLGNPREYFSRAGVHHHLGEWGARQPDSTSVIPSWTPGFDYLRRVRVEAAIDGVLGLKVHWYQIKWFTAAGLFEDILEVYPPQVPVSFVLLRRRDKLSQAISTVIANSTRRYYRKPGQPPAASTWYESENIIEPCYDYERIRGIVVELEEHERSWCRFFARHRLTYRTMLYEDLCTDYRTTLRQVMDYLGADSSVRVPPPQLVKQATPLNERFRQQYLADEEAFARNSEASSS